MPPAVILAPTIRFITLKLASFHGVTLSLKTTTVVRLSLHLSLTSPCLSAVGSHAKTVRMAPIFASDHRLSAFKRFKFSTHMLTHLLCEIL